jgi:hypothetical protein
MDVALFENKNIAPPSSRNFDSSNRADRSRDPLYPSTDRPKIRPFACVARFMSQRAPAQTLGTPMPSPVDTDMHRRDASVEELNVINVAPAPA